MTDMAEANRRDSSAERSITDAARALRAMLRNQDTIGRLTLADSGTAEELAASLERKAAHIVAVWD